MKQEDDRITALWIPCDLRQSIEPFSIRGFTDIQEAIRDMVIPVSIEQPPLTLWLDSLDRRKGLPVNIRATSLRWLWDPDSRRFPALHGPVMLVAGDGMPGRFDDLPEDFLNEFLFDGPFEIQAKTKDDSFWSTLPGSHMYYIDAALWAVVQQERLPDVEAMRLRTIAATL